MDEKNQPIEVSSPFAVSSIFIEPRSDDSHTKWSYPGATYLVHRTGAGVRGASSLADAKAKAAADLGADKIVWKSVLHPGGPYRRLIKAWVPKTALDAYLAAQGTK